MKIIFAGTPEFAVPTLQSLLASEHQLVAVLTMPDRPAGRGRKVEASPVKRIAVAQGLPTLQPTTLTSEILAEYSADVMVVVAYGLILAEEILTLPKYGCINLHPSLLPCWRGATPIQSAIFAGNKETGVSVMQMDAGMDTGPVLKQIKTPIELTENSQTLHQRLADLGAKLILQTLTEMQNDNLQPIAQDNTLATYSKKITKAMASINWQRSASELDCQVRAYNPWPVAQTIWQNKVCRIWQAEVVQSSSQAMPGSIIELSKNGIDVATGDGVLRLLALQLPGRQCRPASDFINAERELLQAPGAKFGE